MSLTDYGASSNQQPVIPRAATIINASHAGRRIRDRKQSIQSKTPIYPNPNANALDPSMFVGQPVFEDLMAPSGEGGQYPVVEGSLNDFPCAGTPEQSIRKLYKSTRFVGFSNNNVRYDERYPILMDDNSVTINGLKDVINSGVKTVSPGDIICWQFPKHDRKDSQVDSGVAKSKLARILEMVPIQDAENFMDPTVVKDIMNNPDFKTAVASLITSVLEEVDNTFSHLPRELAMKNAVGKISQVAMNSFAEALKPLSMMHLNDVASRIVGVSQDYAIKNKRFKLHITPTVAPLIATAMMRSSKRRRKE